MIQKTEIKIKAKSPISNKTNFKKWRLKLRFYKKHKNETNHGKSPIMRIKKLRNKKIAIVREQKSLKNHINL
jgi:hypothetical protein